jgi:Copper transport outer membrane protein, MctB
MFDLRYHVASLTAVFVALVIGILVGIGLSGKGFVNDAERANLTGRIADLEHERDIARSSLDAANRGAQAFDDFADAAYPSVVPGRLEGKRVAVLFVGPVDQGVSFAVAKGVRDAGGTVVRTRSISVPLDVAAIQDGLRGDPVFRRYLGSDHIADLGDALAKELAAGGKTPLWDALGKIIVQEREGSATPPADAVVVVRSAEPQRGLTKALLAGMYGGLARSGVPAVGTEAAGTSPSAIPAFSQAGLSTVDSVDTSAGRLGLVLLLAGGEPGSYGVGETAHDGVLPSIPPLQPKG